jgi:hypothetical protein
MIEPVEDARIWRWRRWSVRRPTLFASQEGGYRSFSLSEGVLPPGMTFSSAGLISGVPSASGTFNFTVRATDAAGAFTEQLCVLRVL